MTSRNPSSPEWRLECEARYLLKLPIDRRRAELAVPARALRRAALEVEMRRIHEMRRKAHG